MAPRILIFPGAYLMELTLVDPNESLQIRCPGCGAVKVFEAPKGDLAFEHIGRCPVLKKIDRALRRQKLSVCSQWPG